MVCELPKPEPPKPEPPKPEPPNPDPPNPDPPNPPPKPPIWPSMPNARVGPTDENGPSNPSAVGPPDIMPAANIPPNPPPNDDPSPPWLKFGVIAESCHIVVPIASRSTDTICLNPTQQVPRSSRWRTGATRSGRVAASSSAGNT